MNDEPLAFYLTWTVYGCFLQGDIRGWRKWGKGIQAPQPRLSQWRSERLKYPVLVFDDEQRDWLSTEIERLCNFRNWKLWAQNVRTNHIHVVIHTPNNAGSKTRDQIKANCTRVLREKSHLYIDRPVWTEGGDWECINSVDDLEQVIAYVIEAQDRKGIGHTD
jgi:REP element-mobilizing transposase RayT